jgi:Uma2 family endonuclease
MRGIGPATYQRGNIEAVSTLLPVSVETMPRVMVLDPPLTDAEFEALCAANDLVHFERTREGEILMHPPAGGFTSQGNAEIVSQLQSWWKTHRRGRMYDSSAGFYLPDGSMLSPDAAYVLPEKLKGLTKDELTGFPRLCPDFVVELFSKSDSMAKTKVKMERWIENGAALGWLIDPYKRKVYVYEPGCKPSAASGKLIRGKGPMEGFALALDEVWRCYEI